jgi:predicted amidohydrolase YtcJ
MEVALPRFGTALPSSVAEFLENPVTVERNQGAGMGTSIRLSGVALGLLALAACGGEGPEEADLVLRGGTIVTVDEANPEVQALAARDGRIVALGSDADVEGFIGPSTEVVDLGGALAIPGLIEGHAHYMGVGRSTLQLNLMDVANWDEVVEMVAAAVAEAEPGELITGRGWHQEKWDRRPEPNVDGLPYHTSLSAVSPDNPVILTHASGHATFANARAMELSGITASTADPDGGEIVRAPSGEPIGAFRETASGLLGPARANASEPDPRRVALLAQEEAFSKGITSFHDAGSGWSTVDLWKSMVDDGDLKIRLYAMIRANPASLAENLEAYRMVGYGDDRLTVRAIKVSIDGALGSHGAWLLEPYDDLPSSSGLNTTPLEDVVETARLAMEHGYQFNVHAIGDRGNRETLDIFEEAYASAGEGDYRWRIEHAQHLHPDDIPRFGELGVIASMQGVHATSDGPWIEAKLGEQRSREGAYVWRKLMDTGAVVMNGTDAPVEDVDPIASYYSTVSRRMAGGEVLFAEQRMTRMEALRSYTINAAYGAFEEDLKGTLAVGKVADVTVLSQDILTIDEDRIPDTDVLYTIVGGEIVYEGAGR